MLCIVLDSVDDIFDYTYKAKHNKKYNMKFCFFERYELVKKQRGKRKDSPLFVFQKRR